MKLTIIIPVYNVEKYLEACLDSIVNQHGLGETFEVIIVNDGSPDNCDRILECYKRQYPSIIILSQANQGLSVARNTGLSNANGDYIWFIDSDDTIELNCISPIIRSLKSDVDILQLNYQLTFEDGTSPRPIYHKMFNGIKSGKEILANSALPAAAPFSIYRRNFLIENSLKFHPNLLHEDSEFKPKATYLADRIMWHRPIVYNYLQRKSGSIMSSYKLKTALDMLFVINSLYKFKTSVIIEPDCKRTIQKMIGLNFNTLLLGSKMLNSDDKITILHNLRNYRFIFIEMIKSRNFKYMIEGTLFKININLGYKFYLLLK